MSEQPQSGTLGTSHPLLKFKRKQRVLCPGDPGAAPPSPAGGSPSKAGSGGAPGGVSNPRPPAPSTPRARTEPGRQPDPSRAAPTPLPRGDRSGALPQPQPQSQGGQPRPRARLHRGRPARPSPPRAFTGATAPRPARAATPSRQRGRGPATPPGLTRWPGTGNQRRPPLPPRTSPATAGAGTGGRRRRFTARQHRHRAGARLGQKRQRGRGFRGTVERGGAWLNETWGGDWMTRRGRSLYGYVAGAGLSRHGGGRELGLPVGAGLMGQRRGRGLAAGAERRPRLVAVAR